MCLQNCLVLRGIDMEILADLMAAHACNSPVLPRVLRSCLPRHYITSSLNRWYKAEGIHTFRLVMPDECPFLRNQDSSDQEVCPIFYLKFLCSLWPMFSLLLSSMCFMVIAWQVFRDARSDPSGLALSVTPKYYHHRPLPQLEVAWIGWENVWFGVTCVRNAPDSGHIWRQRGWPSTHLLPNSRAQAEIQQGILTMTTGLNAFDLLPCDFLLWIDSCINSYC